MEITELEQLIGLLKKSKVREVTLRNGDSRVTLKQSSFESMVEVGGDLVRYDSAQDTESTGAEASYGYATGGGNMLVEDTVEVVTAPLVGVFHHVKPIVGPGATVTVGQVIAVIEAMKLITEVTSPADGVVVETVIKDGMPAEYGQALFLIKTDSGS